MKETRPEAVVENELDDFRSFELLADVVGVALNMKPDAGNARIVESLDYYMENDTFLEL